MELFDICVNLANPRFDPDRAAVIARARDAGVAFMALTGGDADGAAACVAIARDRPGMAVTAGLHPHRASDWAGQAPRIRDLLDRAPVRAVGECGLDFNRNFSTPAEQTRAFDAQLALAADRAMPLFLHERDAAPQMLAMLRAMGGDLPPAVLHCFTGDAAALDGYLELGLAIGVTGWVCDERRGQGLQALVPRIPAGRLMLETDAPWLHPRSLPRSDTAPRKASRNRNEPAHLTHIAAVVADLRGESPASLAAHATGAARRLFGI